MKLYNRDFLTLLDYTPDEINFLLDLSSNLKIMKHSHIPHEYLRDKNIAILFEKDSTRTRCSFEVAAYDLGMHVTYLGPTGSQMGKKETIADTSRVLSRMYDGIEYRGFDQKIVEDLAKYSDKPVWNGLTTDFHPTQMLADFLTIKEEFGDIKGRKVVFCGDARNNVANSLMVISAKLGAHFVAVGPKNLFPEASLIEKCKKIAYSTGAIIEVTEDINYGTKDADCIYTDVWLSMGEDPNKWEERINLLKPYQVNDDVINNAKEECIFLHCLPSFHNIDTKIGKEVYEKFNISEMEVTDKVFEGPHSRVFEEAENRMHTIKAIMYATMYDGDIKL